jgi:hypothetical protein
MILDFTGVGILIGLLLTVIQLLVFVFIALIVCLFKKGKNGKPLSEQSAFKFLRSALIFLAINIAVFLLTVVVYEGISYDVKSRLDGIMFFGWLPFNLFAVFITALA